MVPTQPDLYWSNNHLLCFSVQLFDSVITVRTHLQLKKHRTNEKKKPKTTNIRLSKASERRDFLVALVRLCMLSVLHQSTPVTLSARAVVPPADSQWSRLLPSFCPSCRAAMASLKCSFRLWISRSLRPFIPFSSSCISVYRSQASRFSCEAKGGSRHSHSDTPCTV